MELQRCAEQVTECKCCQADALLWDVCDFSKQCAAPPAPLSGMPVYYYRCSRCGFVFTRSFDGFSAEDFARSIYNRDYYRSVDPAAVQQRPRECADLLLEAFGPLKKSISLLDYGGGSGLLCSLLREHGLERAVTFDPFNPAFSSRPSELFNLVVCFEVFEHAVSPRETLADILSLLDRQNGMAIFSTLLQPADIEIQKTNWWYIAPRNGHISLHTSHSLEAIIAPAGMQYHQAAHNVHYIFQALPGFAQTLFT